MKMASRKILCSKIRSYMEERGKWSDTLEIDLPHKWEHHGDCVIFPASTLKSPVWSDPKLYELICATMKIQKIARRTGSITSGDCYRRPQVELLYGPNGWADKTENGIKYSWDVTKVMFCSGNISEKQRIASWDLSGLVVVDLYAGIGYFTLTYLVHSKAKMVYACEWNPDAAESLRINLRNNHVEDRCVVLEGDNTIVCPQNVADHVNLGLIPSSEPSWEVACRALKKLTGGSLHVHGNVDLKPKNELETNPISDEDIFSQHVKFKKYPQPWIKWSIYVCDKIGKIMKNLYMDEEWTVEVLDIVKVKSYGPCTDHLVISCHVKPCS